MYLSKFNIIILHHLYYILMYSASEWISLDLWRFINVLLIIIINILLSTTKKLCTPDLPIT